MKGLAETIRPLVKRPGFTVVVSVFMLVYCWIEYNFILPLVSGFSYFSSGNVLNSIIHSIQLMFGVIFNGKNILYGLAALVFAALVMGFFMSGSMYSLNRALQEKDLSKGEFIKGVRKYFFRVFWISAKVLLLTFLFLIFVLLVAVPSIVVTNAYINGKEELFTLVLAFDLITPGVLFFAFMFFRIYMLFWYPAAVNLVGKFFSVGKYVADTCFWHMVSRMILFDAAFISLEFILVYLNHTMPIGGFYSVLRIVTMLFLNWIIKTCLVLALLVIVFARFIMYKRTVLEE